MENDIELLKRLLSLSDTLRDLRRKQSLANETNECRPSSKTEAGGYRMQDDPESNDEGQEEWVFLFLQTMFGVS
jgi:hypothetical protein